MTSTEINIGMATDKNSSRVLKPPGGGHTDIFGPSEVKVNNPRPKYDQQNSSNLNFCMNTTDPNVLVEQKKNEIAQKDKGGKCNDGGNNAGADGAASSAGNASSQGQAAQGGRVRVPPGGFSSGLW